MLAITLTSTGYRIMGLLHIISVVAAFGPLFLYPGLRKAGETKTIASMHMKMTFPALIALWVFGMGMAGMSKPKGSDELLFKMSQTWLVLSLIIWVILVAVSWFMIRPAITDESEAATGKLAAGTGIMHLGLVIAVILMIWKPGL